MSLRRLSFLCFPFALLACGGGSDDQPATDDGSVGGDAIVGLDSSGSDSADSATDSVADSTLDGDAPVTTSCREATGSGTEATNVWTDGGDTANVTVSGSACQHTYVISTTRTLRDSMPANPRTVVEASGAPFVRSKNDVFDALYALALAEAKEDSVDSISDGAFNSGAAISCPTGGCFQTGRLWTYVWTRDTSYSVDLALGALDPTRARNSLEFKLSTLRTGGDREMVQDTGSGGSYPISTDRVVWATGAWELLKWLDGKERTDFRDLALDAMKNAIERDRAVAYDAVTGLYRGETSFLDWREQTYPAWTASDTVHIGMSESLSTNVAHLQILTIAAALATEAGDSGTAGKYGGWATSLKSAIASKLWLDADKQLSAYLTTFLDQAPVHRWDALGTALAVLDDVVTPAQAKSALASYPMMAHGVPVIWPQQKETAIYHNRAIWPFVTAYVARAAKKARNDAAVELAVNSLVSGAALDLSNMENFEMASGKPYVDDGSYSGPVVNSQRQLWSVAGYLSMVQNVVFGAEASQTGIRFQPYVTKKLRNGLFRNADSIALNDFAYRGKKISVVVNLPAKGASSSGGAYTIASEKLNGATLDVNEFVTTAKLADANVIEVTLADTGETGSSINLVTSTSDYKNLFGPRAPAVTAIDASSGKLKITWDPNGEAAGEVAFDVYRDGVMVAADLPGSTTSWTDATATASSPSYCYAVEAYFVGSKNHGQHSSPWCWWGTGSTRVKTIDPSTFVAVGGTLSSTHGKQHWDAWGDPGDTLTVSSFVPATTGEHLLQVSYGNGAGPINTGITCGVKLLQVFDGTTEVARGLLVMPHVGTWDAWRDSSFVRASLTAGKSYKIVIGDDPTAANMSRFQHFAAYTGGTGGSSGAFSRVNVAELKVLARVP